MTAASGNAVDGAYGFVLAERDRAHGLSFSNNEYGFGPLLSATVVSDTEAGAFDVPIAGDQPEWLAMPASLNAGERP